MTSAAKARKTAEIDQYVRSGRPLSTEAMAHHLGVDRGKVAEIAKKRGLERDDKHLSLAPDLARNLRH